MSFIRTIADTPGHSVKFNTASAAQHRSAHVGAIKLAGENSIRAVASDGSVDRAGEVVQPEGIDLTEYRKNPVVLWQHIAANPIARCTDIAVRNGQLIADIEFPSPGTSALSDEARGLVKAGIVSGVSIGFNPVESVPMDKANPYGPRRFIRCTLYELSLVSVPANASAVVIERAASFEVSMAHFAHAKARQLEQDILNRSYRNPYLAKEGRVLAGQHVEALGAARGHMSAALSHVDSVLAAASRQGNDTDSELSAEARRQKRRGG